MTRTKSLSRCSLLFLLVAFGGAQLAYGLGSPAHSGSMVVAAGLSQQSATDVTGTWSGTFQSRQPNFTPFTITVVINTDAEGNLIGASSVSSDCLKDGSLHVQVNGASIVLAGGDSEGNHITFRGTIDKTGTLLDLNYVLNGSASARCESDDGAGTMGKR
jgi:hypothetical protein